MTHEEYEKQALDLAIEYLSTSHDARRSLANALIGVVEGIPENDALLANFVRRYVTAFKLLEEV